MEFTRRFHAWSGTRSKPRSQARWARVANDARIAAVVLRHGWLLYRFFGGHQPMSLDHLRAREAESVRIIAAALDTARQPCITCSFQTEGIVVLYMLRRLRPDVPVLFLDTVHHFAETYEHRDRLAKEWGLNLVTLRANEPSPGLWQTSTDACCQRHKVEPLFAALQAYDVWFSGIRREQSPSRASLVEVDSFRLPSGRTLKKVSPLATWTTREVWDYAKAHNIPPLPLYELGYTSIGCEPCTSLPLDPSNPRSGRWRGEKVECGIHIERPAV